MLDRYLKYQTLSTRYLARWSSYINLLNFVVKLNKFRSVDTECSCPICSPPKSIGLSPIIAGFGDDLFSSVINLLAVTNYFLLKGSSYILVLPLQVLLPAAW